MSESLNQTLRRLGYQKRQSATDGARDILQNGETVLTAAKADDVWAWLIATEQDVLESNRQSFLHHCELISSYDGNRNYPFLLIRRDDESATIVKSDIDKSPVGDFITLPIDSETHGQPTVSLNAFETVYLNSEYEVQA